MHRGIREEKIAENYLRENGFEILARRKKVFHTEIDLMVRDEQFLFIVEVKSSRSHLYWLNRISRKQLLRLSRTLVWVSYNYSQPCRLMAVFVSPDGQVDILFPLES